MTDRIAPTVNASVLFYPDSGSLSLPAIIIVVRPNGYIDVNATNPDGSVIASDAIPLIQDTDTPPREGAYATWR